MREYKIVCDRKEICNGKVVESIGVAPIIGNGHAALRVYNDVNSAKENLIVVKESGYRYCELRREYSSNTVEQVNYRIVYREVTEYMEL